MISFVKTVQRLLYLRFRIDPPAWKTIKDKGFPVNENMHVDSVYQKRILTECENFDTKTGEICLPREL
jgi:hypothetical protein